MIYSDTNDEPQFVQNSNYFDDTSLVKKLSTKTNSFNVLSLNCQSINAKIDQLKIKLKQWKNLNCEFSVICLVYKKRGDAKLLINFDVLFKWLANELP